jgi:hypothetical protein
VQGSCREPGNDSISIRLGFVSASSTTDEILQ